LQRLTLLRRDSRTLIPDVIAIGGGHNGRPPRRIRPRRAESHRAQTPLSCWRRGRHRGILSLLPQLCRRYTVSLLNRRSFAISSFIATGCASSRVPYRTSCPARRTPSDSRARRHRGRNREVLRSRRHRLDAYETRLERLTDVLYALALETSLNMAMGQGLAAILVPCSKPPKSQPLAFARTRRAARSHQAPLGRRLSRPMVRDRPD
jgi:hypothetical protein